MGDLSQMFVSGNDTCLLNSGNGCSIISTGKDINISDCGFDTFIASSGENVSITASGDNAHILSTGDNAHIAVTGDDAFVNCFGKNTVISIIGKGCVVTAKDWKDVTFVGVHADLAQLSAKGYTSVTSFNPNSSESEKWRFMNNGKIVKYTHHDNLFNALEEYAEWGRILNINNLTKQEFTLLSFLSRRYIKDVSDFLFVDKKEDSVNELLEK